MSEGDGWVFRISLSPNAKNHMYVYNTKTGESMWELPRMLPEGWVAKISRTLHAGEIKYLQLETGYDTFDYDEVWRVHLADSTSAKKKSACQC